LESLDPLRGYPCDFVDLASPEELNQTARTAKYIQTAVVDTTQTFLHLIMMDTFKAIHLCTKPLSSL
jgi:hypothetical protein